ncbi:MAG: hypothetical protein ACK5N8_06385 [Alphaproteobacteria bacterium]
MKRIVIATTMKQPEEDVQLVFSQSHRRQCRAYLPGMGITEDSAPAFSKEQEEQVRLINEAENIFLGVVSYYYVFAMNSFSEILPFVESEIARMKNETEQARDNRYLEDMYNVQKSLSQRDFVAPETGCSEKMREILEKRCLDGMYKSGHNCHEYLNNIMNCVTGKTLPIKDMKFNFIGNC